MQRLLAPRRPLSQDAARRSGRLIVYRPPARAARAYQSTCICICTCASAARRASRPGGHYSQLHAGPDGRTRMHIRAPTGVPDLRRAGDLRRIENRERTKDEGRWTVETRARRARFASRRKRARADNRPSVSGAREAGALLVRVRVECTPDVALAAVDVECMQLLYIVGQMNGIPSSEPDRWLAHAMSPSPPPRQSSRDASRICAPPSLPFPPSSAHIRARPSTLRARHHPTHPCTRLPKAAACTSVDRPARRGPGTRGTAAARAECEIRASTEEFGRRKEEDEWGGEASDGVWCYGPSSLGVEFGLDDAGGACVGDSGSQEEERWEAREWGRRTAGRRGCYGDGRLAGAVCTMHPRRRLYSTSIHSDLRWLCDTVRPRPHHQRAEGMYDAEGKVISAPAKTERWSSGCIYTKEVGRVNALRGRGPGRAYSMITSARGPLDGEGVVLVYVRVPGV
ncbi:hypothetical protein WOLCODRAFT_167299 [Wolfiporia cocos MD-104 SS10]|uniref:Uncharacterized protein n=1 Tax=Wolfiporia cocos (strain MD-104) TaxID=742152 RepID=A0A2H3J564_WOLCO|nr:hypothetical protein WOLCODRAFT_167299 [Wolfiporia cocos MD-104 SS10]